MARLLPVLRQRFFDANGDPLAGGKLYSYSAGTATPLATYTDASGGTPNANPVVLDANGEANVWIADAYYKFILKDSNDVTQFTIDNVTTWADVFGPSSSTDNTIPRFDGTSGKNIQTSGVVINDLDEVSGITKLAVYSPSATAAPVSFSKTSPTVYAGNYDPFLDLNAAVGTTDSCWILFRGSGSVNAVGNKKTSNNWQLVMNVTGGTPLQIFDVATTDGLVNVGTTANNTVGFKFNNAIANYTPTLLNYFEETTFGATFTQSGGYSQAVTVKATRIGKQVTLEIPAFTATSTANATIVSGTTDIPARFRPATENRSVAIVSNNGVSTTLGAVWFGTGGQITVNASVTGASFPNSTANCGLSAGGTTTQSFTYRTS